MDAPSHRKERTPILPSPSTNNKKREYDKESLNSDN